jgi:hypothetical protein
MDITPRAIRRVAFTCIALLTAAHVLTQLIRLETGHDTLFGLLAKFDLNAERNIPSWYSTCTLATCAIALALTAIAKRKRRDRLVAHWHWLAAIFTGLSIDEFVSLHERLNVPLRSVLGATGLLYFPWVLVGGAFVLVVALAYLPLLASLDRRTRRRFIVSGAIYVGGALGMEVLAAPLYEAAGKNSVPELALITLEEVMELTGSTLFLLAVVDHLLATWPSIVVRVREAASTLTEAHAIADGSLLEVSISTPRVHRAVTAAIVALLAASLSVEALKYGGVWNPGTMERVFNVAMEGSLQTWFEFLLMLACAFWCAAVATALGKAGAPYASTWLFVSGLLVYMSVDEAAGLHELAVRPMRVLLHSPRILYYAWVVPGAAAVVVIALVLRGWAGSLPRPTFRAFVRAALVFVAGALFVEALSGWYAAAWGRGNFGYAVLTTIEEGGEMTGIAMFLRALIDYSALDNYYVGRIITPSVIRAA